MKYILVLFLILLVSELSAQSTVNSLYNPGANAEKDLTEAVKKAKAANKNVIIMAGGNWCNWCHEFNRFSKAEKQIDSVLNSDFVFYHLNYSPENKNLATFARYGYPQRFGFPVFIIVDQNGNRIHTQNSSYLEQGKSYNKRKVLEFLQQWSHKAVSPGG